MIVSLLRSALPALLLACSQAWAQSGASFTAQVSPESVPAGEQATLQLVFTNCQPDDSPVLPEIEGLAIEYRGVSRNEGTRMTIVINGQRMQQNSDRTYILEYSLRGEKEGRYTLPSIEARAGGRTMRTRPISIEVTQAADYSRYARAALSAETRTSRYWAGQSFVLVAELLCASNAEVNELPELAADGFLISPLGDPVSRRERGPDGQIFTRITSKYKARAVKTGPLAIGPARWPVTLHFQRRPDRPRNIFSTGLFDTTIRKEISVESEPLEFEILPLPEEGRPASFTGGVGRFSMRVEASPLSVRVGDPVTLKATVSGEGSLESLKLPPLDGWKDFQLYPESASLEHSSDGIRGRCRFEKVVVPLNAEVGFLPALELAYFDPEAGAYRTLRQDPIALEVRPAQGSPASLPPIASPESSPGDREPSGPAHIKSRIGTAEAHAGPLLSRSGFLWLQALPVLAWLAACLAAARKEALAGNPAALRQRRVRALVRQGLGRLGRLSGEGDSEQFHALLLELLQEQIGLALGQPARSVTEEALEADALRLQLDPRSLEQLQELFQSCNQSRYAQAGSPGELDRLLESAREALDRLQRLPVSRSS